MNDFEWFVEKWGDKLSGSEVSLNLLQSPAENDFAGMLEITDQSNVDGSSSICTRH